VGAITDLDIYRAANLLIGLHGADAELEAAPFVALMHVRGENEKLLVWMRITRAIGALLVPPAGKPH
jgi:hypothetical protein